MPVDVEGHRTPAVGHAVGASPGVLRHGEWRALVVIAHPLAYVRQRHLALRDDVQRHGLLVHVALDELGVLVHALVELAEEAPHTSLAGAQPTEVVGVIGLLEVEVLILALEPAVLASEVDDVLLVHAVLLVAEGDLVDAGLIGVCADGVIRDADSYPGGALLLRALADHLQHPDLVLVRDSEGLARAVVAVVSYQTGHDADGLAGRLATLQGDVDQAAVVHDTLGVGELLAPAPGTLGDGHLVLVHIAYDIVGDGGLGDEAEGFARVPLVYLEHEPLAPALGGVVDEVTIEGVRVSGVADHDGAVGGGLLADNQVGAGCGALGRECCQRQRTGPEDSIFSHRSKVLGV